MADGIALLRLSDLYLESFEVKDVKVHLPTPVHQADHTAYVSENIHFTFAIGYLFV